MIEGPLYDVFSFRGLILQEGLVESPLFLSSVG